MPPASNQTAPVPSSPEPLNGRATAGGGGNAAARLFFPQSAGGVVGVTDLSDGVRSHGLCVWLRRRDLAGHSALRPDKKVVQHVQRIQVGQLRGNAPLDVFGSHELAHLKQFTEPRLRGPYCGPYDDFRPGWQPQPVSVVRPISSEVRAFHDQNHGGLET